MTFQQLTFSPSTDSAVALFSLPCQPLARTALTVTEMGIFPLENEYFDVLPPSFIPVLARQAISAKRSFPNASISSTAFRLALLQASRRANAPHSPPPDAVTGAISFSGIVITSGPNDRQDKHYR